ncbi:MAG: SH3 domain-containing protein [Verrucomicrobia bacterium]|nr:SH3 domain-containing protein [Verrucomicrobiota bacterium]MCF7708315.1 SH3 domain-containing protein [Verrucomicrobiota bacterium]
MKTQITFVLLAAFTLTAAQNTLGETKIAEVLGNYVNVRGQPTINSEVITQLDQGDEVVFIEKLTIENEDPADPTEWARIRVPEEVTVWVHKDFIDANDSTVTADPLNIRGGPGQNYSVLGQLEQGTKVERVSDQGFWMGIKPPTNAYAFIAADLISKPKTVTEPKEEKPDEQKSDETQPDKAKPAKQGTSDKEAEPAEAQKATEPAEEKQAQEPEQKAPEQETVETTPPPAPIIDVPSTEKAAEKPKPKETKATEKQAPPAPDTEKVTEEKKTEPEKTKLPEPVEPRVVAREGVVKYSFNIQSPTSYKLESFRNGEILNYLHTTSKSLELKKYSGKRVLVRGQEYIDPNWPNTPVLEIESIMLIQ